MKFPLTLLRGYKQAINIYNFTSKFVAIAKKVMAKNRVYFFVAPCRVDGNDAEDSAGQLDTGLVYTCTMFVSRHCQSAHMM